MITAGALTADAAGAMTLDTSVDSADLSTSAAGSISVDETDAITLTDVDTSNGAITITAGGAITATDVASSTDSDANDITLTGVGIAVTKIDSGSTAGDVVLDAGTGAITQDATDDKDDVTADSLTADAATGIDLDTTVLSADLSVSGTGSIVLDELNAILSLIHI